MRFAMTLMILILLVTGCERYLSWRHPEVKETATALMNAGIENDSVALSTLAASDDVVSRLAVLREQEPELLKAAAKQLDLQTVTVRGDTTIAILAVPYKGQTETMSLWLVQARGGSWAVLSLGFPNRL